MCTSIYCTFNLHKFRSHITNLLDFKGHFTKVYSIKGCELQKLPRDPQIGLGCVQTLCLQLNPIGGSQENFEVHTH